MVMSSQQASIENRLAEVLSPEYIDSLIKLVKIVRRMDELGLLDTLLDLLDEGVIEDFAHSLVNTNTALLISNMDDAVGAAVKLVMAFRKSLEDAKKDTKPALSILTELLTDENAKRGLRILSALLKNLGSLM